MDSNLSRRRFVVSSGLLAGLGAVAGCTGSPTGEGSNPGTTTDDRGTDTTTTTADGVAEGSSPGADQLGGPGDLQSAPTVRATVLEEDAGAGTFVNTPAVVWVESGATVTWEIEGAAHSVTAYHPDNDRPLRIPDGASSFDSGTLSAGESFQHTFETGGVYDYFCRPHESLGMVGLVIVDSPSDGPGTTSPDLDASTANQRLSRLLSLAGVQSDGGGDDQKAAYSFQDATWDTYWYSLYNMSTNIAMSGNGVLFPRTDEQRQTFQTRLEGMLGAADADKPPVANPNLNVAPFTEGDPHFTQRPVFDAGDGRPDANTLAWDRSKASMVVSPGSVAWTHLKGITWAKNFENHFETLPPEMAAKFRAQMLATLGQLGVKATLIDGGPQNNGLLTKGDTLTLLPGVNVAEGSPVGTTPRVADHAAMVWYLADLRSLAEGGWFGYENPEPLVPPQKLGQLTDGVAKTTMEQFDPEDVVSSAGTRDAGLLLGALGWYGTHAGSESMATSAADYANSLADAVESQFAGNGRVEGGGDNQAATQGVVGQGLLWASKIEGVDRTDAAERVLSYLLDELWDPDAGTLASSSGADTYRYTARDAGDLTGGVNAADAVLGMDVREQFASTFDQLFNRGRLQRAERPPSRDPESQHPLPLPPKAGGEFGQAAVYNGAVEYDRSADEWSVVDRSFRTAEALYLANQDIWMSHWGGEFFEGRGVPGENDTPS